MPSQRLDGLNMNHTRPMKRTTAANRMATPTQPLTSRTLRPWRRVFAGWGVLGAGLAFGLSATAAGFTVGQMRCEYLDNPLGIDTPQPRLSWVLESRQRAQTQTAYQILVASSEALLKAAEAVTFGTRGKVASDQTLQVVYAGKALGSCQRCYWKVRVWDKDGKASAYSQPAYWEMGLLSPQDWQGQWIARTTDTNSKPAPMLRHAFTLEGKIKQARAYICGLGYYELHINGKKIGDHLLDPGYTRYDKRALYVTYDVTDALRRGKNAVGVILGNGWYNVQTRAVWDFHKAPWRAAPKLLMQLRVEYTDGRVETIGTDSRWKTSTGPITFDSIYGGETYDARAGEARLGHAGLRRFARWVPLARRWFRPPAASSSRR